MLNYWARRLAHRQLLKALVWFQKAYGRDIVLLHLEYRLKNTSHLDFKVTAPKEEEEEEETVPWDEVKKQLGLVPYSSPTSPYGEDPLPGTPGVPSPDE